MPQRSLDSGSNLTSSTAEVISAAAGFAGLAGEWDALVAAMPRPSPFLGWTWLHTWWEHFGGGSELRLVTLRDAAGLLLGVAPLHLVSRRAAGVPVRSLEMLGYRGSAVCADHLDFLLRGPEPAGAARVLLRAVLALPGWDALILADLAEHSPLRAIFAELAAAFAPRSEAAEICYFRSLPPTRAEFEAELRRQHKKLANDLRYNRKRLQQRPGTRFVPAPTGPAEVSAVLADLARLHGLARGRQGESGNFCLPAYRAFHEALAPRLAAEDRLYLARLESGHQTVAVLYGFVEAGVFYYYQSGFDTALSSLGLGKLMLGEVMEDAAERLGLHEFDFLRGGEEYKSRWSSGARHTWHLYAWRGTLA
ncbi:MAG: GNAT family N-acetyltransferase, partial [Terriglobales bacterium]